MSDAKLLFRFWLIVSAMLALCAGLAALVRPAIERAEAARIETRRAETRHGAPFMRAGDAAQEPLHQSSIKGRV